MEAKSFEPVDGGGNVMKLKKIGERRLVPSVRAENWCGMRDVKTRVDDVFIIEYAKSGLHWIYEDVAMLRRGETELMNSIMELNHIDFLTPALVNQMTSPRTMCTHRYSNELPADMLDQKCKIIQLVRNPKDVCVSYFHHLREMKSLEYGGSFDDFISLYKRGDVPFNSWEDHFLHWKKFKHDNPGYPIHTIRYEDMKSRPVEEIKKMADFLDISCSEMMCQNIALATAFAKMKQQKESLENKFLYAFKSGKEIMYRKGETGDWKNYFSSAEAESFDAYYRQKLDTLDHIYLSDKPSSSSS
ncbi:sulfotransferase 6B1 [Patella vulgata]|uniref:sulfotransferase 6B1 n=1 Tax=Patella vulgata TaxID=6465 RepID=UPI00217FD761|nr:sulfotransferase 6B1 [Patella vulgata]